MSKEETTEFLNNIKGYSTSKCNLLIFFREENNIINEKEPFDSNYSYRIKEYNIEEITKLLNDCGYNVLEIIEKPFLNDEKSLCPKL